MNCKNASGLISEYVDGCLEGDTRTELESHIAGCSSCSAELASTRNVVAALGAMGGLRSPVRCWDRVEARIAAVERQRAQWWRWLVKPVIAAPAAAVMALLALFLMWPLVDAGPAISDAAYAPEYSYYIGAHSHLQRRQAFADPDAVFIKAEMQRASLVSE